jgi:hypothetical protein
MFLYVKSGRNDKKTLSAYPQMMDKAAKYLIRLSMFPLG